MAKILIVEDNEMNRDMLSRRLERRGYVVVMAVDGVAMSKVELPDIVLMDMSLPILNGWEATRAIKADALTAHIPVIALTAHSMPVRRRADRCSSATESWPRWAMLYAPSTSGRSHSRASPARRRSTQSTPSAASAFVLTAPPTHLLPDVRANLPVGAREPRRADGETPPFRQFARIDP